MKYLIFTSFVFLATLAEARTSIPTQQLGMYKAAVNAAIKWSDFECSQGIDGVGIPIIINMARSGTLSEEGEQPVIMLSLSPTDDTTLITRITSAKDNKTIISIEKQYFKMEDVNKGDLRSPIMVREFVLQGSQKCINIYGQTK